LSNFKSDSSLQQWEGEDFRTGQRKPLNFNPLSLSKRERKLNYSVDSYFKETMRAGPSKTEKAPKLPRAPKQISLWVDIVLFMRSRLDKSCVLLQTRLPVFPT
jgi:SWI/SNF-related matrix-associated actin-dependent regulator of chromatin subfamily A member 5